MSKIMSVFEKLNLVEKVDDEVTDATKIENNNIKEQVEPKIAEYDNDEFNMKFCQPANEEEQIDMKTECLYENNMTIKEIYTTNGIENCEINTVFMLGNFINALPENLPYEVRKQSITNIIQAANTDLGKLVSDGEKRLNILNEFSKNYHNSITNTIEQYKAEIEKLNNLVNNYKEQIYIKETMLEEQNNIIKYETEKINKIITFFRNDV